MKGLQLNVLFKLWSIYINIQTFVVLQPVQNTKPNNVFFVFFLS